MGQNLSKLAEEAQRMLDLLNQGKSYPTAYVIDRFEKAAENNVSDQLIGTMRDVLVKRAKKQEFFTQAEIGSLYDEMYGLSGGQTAFRLVLGDLLSGDQQLTNPQAKFSKTRTMEEKPLNTSSPTELSKTFAAAFSLGQNNNFATYQPRQDQSIVKAVISKLSTLGHPPIKTEVVNQNDHFALCLAYFDTPSFQKVAVKIPVQISHGLVQEPELIIDQEKTIGLTKDNLYLTIKAEEHQAKTKAQTKQASGRGNGLPMLETPKVAPPAALKDFTELENSLMAAASKFDAHQIQYAREMLASELISFGAIKPEIKVAASSSDTVIFDAYLPTTLGKTVIHVPVEMVNGKPLLPHKFAVDLEVGKNQVYDFSQTGYDNFIVNLQPKSASLTVARENGELSRMTHAQLLDRIVEGVAVQDYKLSEDALATIQSRFGAEHFKSALDYFTQLLKYASTNSGQRQKFVEVAIQRGDLIRIPTSVEWYSPKLGLPLSKISFDEKGRLLAKGRREKSELSNPMISTNQIVLT